VLGSELSGTPDYIAPETIQGQVKPGDAHLVDVYALGVVGYELLTGLLPYPAEELSELFQQILHHPTPRVRAERPEVPYALDVLLASMMAKEQGDRPDSIDAVHYQLSAIAEGRSLDPRGRRLRVVAVDDDDDYLELIRSCTEQLQEEVDLRLANEGPKALELLREDPCDLLIADLDMPQMSGMELFMHVRAMPEARDTLVAIISGTAKPSDRALLTQMGVIDFIEKKGQTFGLLVERFESLVARAAAARAPT
jgi:CheY-like chemotaxis protein